MSLDHPKRLAALDLGSNSFHLLICDWDGQQLREIARFKELVQLARDFNADGTLSHSAIVRARQSLRNCQQTISDHSPDQLRIVGTEILRQANRTADFSSEVEELFGQPLDIICGDEEATLMYRGVSQGLSQAQRETRSLIVDVGGASTELVTGKNARIEFQTSLKLGCVTLGNRFFSADRPITSSLISEVTGLVRQLLAPHRGDILSSPVELAIGACGAIRTLWELFGEPGQSPKITRTMTQELLDQMTRRGHLSSDLPENLRFDVLPAGITILSAVMDEYELEHLAVSQSGIKEGMMLEMISPTHKEPRPL